MIASADSANNHRVTRGHEDTPAIRQLALARIWGVAIENRWETHSSLIAVGWRDTMPVVLKVVKRESDEWRSGEIQRAFDSRGAARVYEHTPGALLVERVRPGTSLAALSLTGRDEEATAILATVIAPCRPLLFRLASPQSAIGDSRLHGIG
jgi:streptomycin 6-kinase